MYKWISIFIVLSICFSEENKKFKLDLKDLSCYSKKIEIKGLLEADTSAIQKDKKLYGIQIEEIKKKAKDFQVDPVTEDEIAIIETSRGKMKLKLFPDKAPNHCHNFKKLANSGFYDETRFHRVIPGFMIQGGDILSRDEDRSNDGTGGPGWTIDAEFNDTPHKRGILSMARASDPNSAGSQFFICVSDAPHLDGKYTAFGEVIDGFYVMDHIVNAMTDAKHVRMFSKSELPQGADPQKWIKVKDPKTKKFLYVEIPSDMNANSFKYETKKKLRSDNPVAGAIINKIRVVKKSSKKDGQ